MNVKKFYTVKGIAEMLMVDKCTIYREIERKRLKSTKVGGALRISEKQLEDYLYRDEEKPVKQTQAKNCRRINVHSGPRGTTERI